MQKAPKGLKVGEHIHIKAYLNALVLTVRESRKFQSSCQKQSNGNVLWGVLYTALIGYECILAFVTLRVSYIHALTWGFQRCSFRQLGQCESLRIVERATDWLHVLRMYVRTKLLTANLGSLVQKKRKTSMRKFCLLIALLMSVQFVSAQRKTVIVETPQTQVQDEGMVLKRKVAIGRFSNETQKVSSMTRKMTLWENKP